VESPRRPLAPQRAMLLPPLHQAARNMRITSRGRTDNDREQKLETIQIENISISAFERRPEEDSRARPRRPAAAAPACSSLTVVDRVAKFGASKRENSCAEPRFAQIVGLPNTHVPVVACRLAGIWTRGQSTALGRPAAGGEPAHPAQRGTRLEATTDRAFLVSAGPPKVGAQRGLSILPGVRTGSFLVQTMALIA
jgi:hypothetical protein